MTTKKYAVSPENATIALKYGRNVSRGIAEMERLLQTVPHVGDNAGTGGSGRDSNKKMGSDAKNAK